MLTAAIFAHCGYDVAAIDPSPMRRELADQRGPPEVLENLPLEDPRFEGHVGLVLECSGNDQAVLAGSKVLTKGGEIILIATPWARKTDLTAHDMLLLAFHNHVTIRSGWEWSLPTQPTEFRRNNTFGNYRVALDWLADGRVAVEGLCQTVPPRQAQDAYTQLRAGSCRHLSVVFDWTDLD